MKLFTGALVGVSSVVVAGLAFNVQAQQSGDFTGTVEQVWEDGLRLDTGDRTLRVDTWEVHGDATANYVAVGDQITVSGEFSGREFDADSISSANDRNPVSHSVPEATVSQASDTTYTGTVERLWEDGFRLNTGDRTLRVDAWNLCGDATARFISAGDRLTATGEFDGGEFDAFSITKPDGGVACPQSYE
ncbi:MAG: hypothetical protein AAFP20_17710 [Cyanobacteria bacterium J06614_10]